MTRTQKYLTNLLFSYKIYTRLQQAGHNDLASVQRGSMVPPACIGAWHTCCSSHLVKEILNEKASY